MEDKKFNIEIFDIKLDTQFIGRNFYYYDELDSTNSFLMDKKFGAKENGCVVLAEFQTSGRGRLERTWESQKNLNLTFSILFTELELIENSLSILNLATSLVVAQSIENLFQLKTDLKWPNDILIKEKKVAGILLESSSSGSKLNKLIIGIGLNVNQSKFLGEYKIPPTSIRIESRSIIERERVLAEILNNHEEMIYKLVDNPSSMLNDWKNKCSMIGEKICIEQNGKLIYGVFEDIDDEGYLLLRTKKKIEKINFGDVSVI